jgi:hypothetical protein
MAEYVLNLSPILIFFDSSDSCIQPCVITTRAACLPKPHDFDLLFSSRHNRKRIAIEKNIK